MSERPRAVIEAKPENPGRLVVHDAGRERRIPLTPLSGPELDGLAAELTGRGYQVEQHDADIAAQVPAHSAEAALRALGETPPYPDLDAARGRSLPPAPS